MPAKLSQREKNSRGTAQKCRALKARPLRVIRSDIRAIQRVIKDMQYNLSIARKSVRADGALIEVVTADSNGRFAKTRRLNPSFKIQREALTALKSLNRQMDFLCEEREAAEAAQHKSAETEEFKI